MIDKIEFWNWLKFSFFSLFFIPSIALAGIHGTEMDLDYIDIIDSEIKGKIVEFWYKTDFLLDRDIISSSAERVSSTTYVFYSGDQFYKENDIWYQMEFATTTFKHFFLAEPLSFFRLIPEALAQTFFPSIDGFVMHAQDASWATVRNGAGNYVDSTSAITCPVVIEANNTVWRKIRRAVFLFDTSTLSDIDTIASATFNFRGSSRTDVFNQDIVLTNSAPDSDVSLVEGDYNNNMASEKASNRIDVTAYNTTGYNVWDLVSPDTEISKTSFTKLGLRASGDFDDIEPAKSINEMDICGYLSEQTGTDSDPKLIVTIGGDPPPSSATSTFATTTPWSIVEKQGMILFFGIILFFITTLGTFYYLRYNIL